VGRLTPPYFSGRRGCSVRHTTVYRERSLDRGEGQVKADWPGTGPGQGDRPLRRAAAQLDQAGARRATRGESDEKLLGRLLRLWLVLIDQDRVADGDPAVVEDVRVEPAAVEQLLDDPRPRHLLQMQARLADLDAKALDFADPEAPGRAWRPPCGGGGRP
jgi:hypothetical protein